MKFERINLAREIKNQRLQDFDKKHGVDFSRGLTRVDLGYEGSHHFGYQPSFIMPHIFSHLNISSHDSILDIGCGKGYAMHLFSALPFERIDGIELNGELVRIARNNLCNLHHGDSRFHVFEIDACDFMHYEDYDVIYLFNPFDDVIIETICLKLGNHRPRKVIYQVPHYVNTFIRHGFEIEYEADATVVLKR
jgi:spermidine synthase